MIVNYILILGIGHLLGDFYFQNEKIAKKKDETITGVFLHSAEYYLAVLVVIIPVFCLNMFLAATCASLFHFVIDTLKFILLKKKKIQMNGNVFIADQCAHVICILGLAYMMNCWNFKLGHLKIVNNIFDAFNLNVEITARWILAVLFIHIPANIFIQNSLSEYKPKDDERLIKVDGKAGRRIGTTERMIMLIFLYLLGTLLSTLCVIVCKAFILG